MGMKDSVIPAPPSGQSVHLAGETNIHISSAKNNVLLRKAYAVSTVPSNSKAA